MVLLVMHYDWVYLIPLPTYLASNIGVTLKSGL